MYDNSVYVDYWGEPERAPHRRYNWEIVCMVVRPSPARRGWSHEVCWASVTPRGCLYRAPRTRVQTISNIFAPQTTFQHEHIVQCGRRRREETLRRSSWSVNVYCTRTGSCEVATYRTQKAADSLIVQVE